MFGWLVYIGIHMPMPAPIAVRLAYWITDHLGYRQLESRMGDLTFTIGIQYFWRPLCFRTNENPHEEPLERDPKLSVKSKAVTSLFDAIQL